MFLKVVLMASSKATVACDNVNQPLKKKDLVENFDRFENDKIFLKNGSEYGSGCRFTSVKNSD
jgi:hypothetical protein